MSGNDSKIVDEHLQGSYSFKGALEDSTLPDLYVSLVIEPTETTLPHISASHEETRRLPDTEWEPRTLSEWLRYGLSRQLHRESIDVCHPWQGHTEDINEIDWRILPAGYHKPGACVAESERCLFYEIWGGAGHPGQLNRHPTTFAASSADNFKDGVALEGVWRLTLREIRPEYIGLITSAISALAATRQSFALDIGDVHTFPVDVREATVINPLYSPAEIQAELTSTAISGRMSSKRILWMEEIRDGFTEALSDRLGLDAFTPPEVGHDAQ